MVVVLVLFVITWFGSLIQFSACLTWTKYPDSTTSVWNGTKVELQWDYNLTTAEQTTVETAYSLFWKRSNASHLVNVAAKIFNKFFPPVQITEPLKPHITVSRSEKATLIINDVTKEDEGAYKIILFITVANSRNTTLHVKVQPTIRCPEIVKAPQGEQAIISCNVTGDPKPNVTWTKESPFGSVLSHNSTLVIDHVLISDGGTYEITADNGRSKNNVVKLEILYAAKINYTSGTQTLNQSDTYNPTCVADGNPTPNITWTRVSDQKLVSLPLRLSGKKDEDGYKCTASNGVGSSDARIVYLFVQNHQPVNTSVTTNLTNNTVVVNKTFSVTCSAQANPPAKYRFYKGIENVNDPYKDAVITTSVTERVKMVNYSCIPFNFYGNGIKSMVAVTVYYAPADTKLISVPSNTTVLHKSLLRLICQVHSSPEAEFRLYFNGSHIKTSSSGIFPVTVISDGVYICVPSNKVGVGKNASVSVTVVEAPSVSVLPQAVAIVDGNSLNLTCYASGKPRASLKWTMDNRQKILSTDSQLTVNVSRRVAKNNMIHYQCTASNGVGTPATAIVSITVHYPAVISKPENVTEVVKIGQEVDLPCSGEGYPKPIIILTAIYINGSYLHHSSGDSKLSVKADSPVWFQCTVENDLAKRTKWFHLVLNAMKFEITISIVNKACSNPGEIIKQLRELMTNILLEGNIPVENVESVTFRCGSVTVYFSLIFGENVEIEKVLTVLKKGVTEKKFGDLQVDPKSIQAISPERIPPTPTPVDKTTEEPKCKDGFIPEGNCPLSAGLIAVVVVLAVILFSATFAIIGYCLYKRRKCRKDLRVHSSISEEKPFGYAETGPRSTEIANLDHHQGEEGAAAIPNYAVVNKSKKKDKKKDKKAAEMKPTEDQHAVVDMSKKKTKLKSEPDANYAEVDWQKKAKKKPKQGEILYADLDEFHPMKKMPKVSTSPEALHPIKRPEAYAETQYADITQFLMVNPEDPDAEPPKDNTTPAVSNTATGSKEESSARNTGDSAEATDETGF